MAPTAPPSAFPSSVQEPVPEGALLALAKISAPSRFPPATACQLGVSWRVAGIQAGTQPLVPSESPDLS
ncbi:hypothetical protein PAL_GLEAN10006020 [Pteropus alecto]|uniref:Uncharacterized protein n=1 Tax=Pteropus alecto TaxID=9402 RepID=L5L8J8_PTEAL|nr:hypothetical protein PAL_GLEAN10006020 [Pteropus alecto]